MREPRLADLKTPIITHLTDTDFYKLTMWCAVFNRYPDAWVKYKYKCRNAPTVKEGDVEMFVKALNHQLDILCNLTFQDWEIEYLAQFPFFNRGFLEFLRMFKANRNHIKVDIKDDDIDIVVEGPWFTTIFFEVPVLAIVSELIPRASLSRIMATDYIQGKRLLREKIDYVKDQLHPSQLADFKFADFGTRRRFCKSWQEEVLNWLKAELPNNLVGTSNVFFARKLGLKPIGTMAHEYLQAHQQLGPRIVDSQRTALKVWSEVFDGQLGIALTDVISMDAFLRDFGPALAKQFDGCRHDSGSPTAWANRLIHHYKKLGIDPKTKTAVFSDGLNFKTALELFYQFIDHIGVSFGIGTWLTNDMGSPAPKIVMKMVECNGAPVAKLSDDPGKGMCEDPEYVEYVKHTFRY
jgi:nicotinate phosphoribosyltransferase